MTNPNNPAPMREHPIWAPGSNSKKMPNTARVRDFWLGGSHHTSADQLMAEQFTLCAPHLPYLVRTHRNFLRRVVSHLVRAGVRQFVDLGSGMPTMANVHEVALGLDPECRVVYSDIDPVVVTESTDLLEHHANPFATGNTAYISADLTQPDQVLDAPELRALLDPREPVAVLMLDVLHFVPDSARPADLVAAYADAFGRGSYVAISHTCHDERMLDAVRLFSDIYSRPLPAFTFRYPADVVDLLKGVEIVEPGVVPIPLWHPDQDEEIDRYPEHFQGCAALARVP